MVVDNYGRSDYGRSDYGRSDYGRADYGRADYGRSDYGRSDYGRSDYSRSDYGRSDYGRSAYGRPWSYKWSGSPRYGAANGRRHTWDTRERAVAAPGSRFVHEGTASERAASRHTTEVAATEEEVEVDEAGETVEERPDDGGEEAERGDTEQFEAEDSQEAVEEESLQNGFDGAEEEAEETEETDTGLSRQPPTSEVSPTRRGTDAVEEVPVRSDDLALEEVPEEMRESVEGNLALKRMLSSDVESTPSASSAKRRRVADAQPQTAGRHLEGVKADVVAKWKLEGNLAVTYVLESAELEDVERLHRSNWHPSRFDEQNSCAEQISDKLVRAREGRCPPGGMVDALAAFKHRWKLGNEDDDVLCELCHKDMRYVIAHYDGTRPIRELVDEAGMMLPGEGKTVDAAPDMPGLSTLGRFNRLELIDPIADALVVGDANLTFSLLLAEHREDLGHVGRIVATTFETIETLRERYSEIDNTVKLLEDQSAEVLHSVDCTRLAVDPRFVDMTGKFGAVYYNFPHAGVVRGFFDSHPFVRWRHENLMELFFRALRGFVKAGGCVKVASNSSATGVRYSDILAAAKHSEFVHIETMPFLEWRLRHYRRSYGDRRDANRRLEGGEIYKNQKAHSDMVYCFRYSPSGEPLPKPRIRYPPAKQDLLDSNEGWFKTLTPAVKRRRIEDIYRLFLSYVQGIHVG